VANVLTCTLYSPPKKNCDTNAHNFCDNLSTGGEAADYDNGPAAELPEAAAAQAAGARLPDIAVSFQNAEVALGVHSPSEIGCNIPPKLLRGLTEKSCV